MSLQPLSVDVSFSWHPYLWAFFLETFSLDIIFSLHLILLTQFRLAPFFLFPVLSDYYSETSSLRKWFHLTPSVLTSRVSSGHLFLLTFSYLANKIHATRLAQNLHGPHPAQSISEYYFALQSLHKVLYIVLLRTSKLAQSTSQYYFGLHSLHKVFPSICTAKLAQNTSQYYFVLESLHKVLPSTTSYSTSYFKDFTHSKAFTHRNFLHTEAAHRSSLDAATPVGFTMSS